MRFIAFRFVSEMTCRKLLFFLDKNGRLLSELIISVHLRQNLDFILLFNALRGDDRSSQDHLWLWLQALLAFFQCSVQLLLD